ncbi:MAG TPA: bifunctional (p)ppGpp synthetase/guanosine-3',5'-bis(diphosphate) 3'-pyrophosphohydrolase [Armatimonadota bacterium]|nr:bifunctional (p)ppGpp synthetase/guanosine-3',5'-bis(diphosphate) 3'-pyrophosphohydrolase [Armatimonadota bacterium]
MFSKENQPVTIEGVIEKIGKYNPKADMDLIRRAYEFAANVHEGQSRLSGEPYINHPLATASILTDLEMDAKSIAAALLHDVIEDTGVHVDELAKAFDKEIAQLVDGVTKLKLADFEMRAPELEHGKKRHTDTRSAENLRKIFLAMARDFRVMVIKLADRLHNMRTLSALPPERQIKVASETLQIYAPLAHRLGIWQIKWQLEDLAFKHLHPDDYKNIVERVSKTRKERESELDEAIAIIKKRFEKEHIKAEIHGRPKHLFGIYQKMLKQEVDYDEIYDLIAVRIIVDTVADCYHALGVVHDQWMPITERFADYIAKPKSNMYQSLHTKAMVRGGEPLEIQIRTWEMHRMAEYGIAAHWQYKEGGSADQQFERKLTWLRQQLFDWQSDAKDDIEFLRGVTEDLFADQVFVFTPKGDVIDLPAGSTPVDFAFRIHSDLGNHIVGGKVNGRIVPLTYKFSNGDIVEVISRSNAQPSLDWLNFVKTSTARSRIKAYFRRLRYAESVAKGREMIEKEIERLGLDRNELLKAEHLEKLPSSLNVQSVEDLFAAIGYGHTPALTVVHKLAAMQPPTAGLNVTGKRPAEEARLGIVAGGVDDVAIRRSKCCTPIPGDEVVGYVTRGRGLTIHRKGCPNLAIYGEKEPDRLVEVEWTESSSEKFQTGIHIESLDRVGLLNDISAMFSETKTNIFSAKITSHPDKTASFDLTIEVADAKHLNNLMTRIGSLSDILEVRRTSLPGESG